MHTENKENLSDSEIKTAKEECISNGALNTIIKLEKYEV
ncbi:hypothetical protein NEIG_01282, partial [Nematocida sp. ERTm5]